MGSDHSKNHHHKAPSDPDPAATHLFSSAFPAPGDYESFAKQLSLPLKGASIIPSSFKEGERLHLEAAQKHLQNFSARLFQGFSPETVGTPKLLIPKDQYVSSMKNLISGTQAPRLDFLLKLYTTPLDADYLDYEALTALLNEIITLYDHLHTKEETQIAEFGYCIVETPEDLSSPSEVPSDSFVPLKESKKSNARAPTRSKEVEEVVIDVIEPPKKETPQTSFATTFVVPKHKVEDVLPTQDDNEAQLRKEVLEMMESEKNRSAQIVQLSDQIVSSIVSAIFKDSHAPIDPSLGTSERSALKVEVEAVKKWITTNLPKAADVLLALVRLQIMSPLSANENELVKKQYHRMAPQPDPVEMEKSVLWGPAMIWTMHQHFTLKGVNAFKLLYSSATHGRSLNRFIHHVIGYKAETLFIITTTKREIFGAFIATPWEMSSNYWSNSNCFLFGVAPVLAIRHGSSHSQPNFAYFFNNKKSFTGKPVGIGFGGTVGNFRLWIDEDLLTGTVRTMDPTYENGTIASNPAFDIASIEVWGSCTEYAQQQLLRERRLREKDSERARKAMGKDGWNEGADKFIMDLVGKTGHSDGILESIQKERREAKEREAALAAMREKMQADEAKQSSAQ
jgi:hypothetical protein